jgi:hypothetical protein
MATGAIKRRRDTSVVRILFGRCTDLKLESVAVDPFRYLDFFVTTL